MKKVIDFLKAQPLVTTIIAVSFIAVSVRFLGAKMDNNLDGALLRIGLAFAAMAFLYLISGSRTFDKCCGTTGYAFRILLPTLIFPLLGLIMGVIGCIQDKNPLRSDWPLQLLILAFYSLSIGLLEEVTARGILNDGPLYQFRSNKKIFVIIAVVNVIVFGGIHLLGSSITSPMELGLAVLKVLSSGIGGLCYLFIYWKTRNIWAVALSHGLYDFLLSVQEAFFDKSEAVKASTNYVSLDGQEAGLGVAVLVLYAVDVIISLIIAIWIWKKFMKDVDFDELRETW